MADERDVLRVTKQMDSQHLPEFFYSLSPKIRKDNYLQSKYPEGVG